VKTGRLVAGMALLGVLALAGTSTAQEEPAAEAQSGVLMERLERRREELAREIERIDGQIAAARAGAPAAEPAATDDRRRGSWREGQGWDRRGPSREEVRAFLDEHLPGVSARLEELERASDPGAESAARFAAWRARELMWLRGRDEALFQARLEESRSWLEIMDQARALRAAADAGDAPAQEQIRGALRDLASRHVEAQLASHRAELDSLRRRVETVGADLERKVSERGRIAQELYERIIARSSPGVPAEEPLEPPPGAHKPPR
jgi:hypothetical protein